MRPPLRKKFGPSARPQFELYDDYAGQAAGVVGDPFWPFVNLLVVYQNGKANGNTAFDDASGLCTIGVNGAAQWDTAQFPSGMNDSLLGNGTDADIYGTYAGFAYGAGLFTAEVYFRVTSLAANRHLIANRFGDLLGPSLYVNTSGVLVFAADGGTVTSGGTVSVGTWNHAAMVRGAGNAGRLYFNGDQVGAGTIDGNYTSNFLHVMSDGDGNNYFPGNVVVAKSTKGVARYTGTTYTIPALPALPG